MSKAPRRESLAYDQFSFTRRLLIAGAAGVLASKLVGCGDGRQNQHEEQTQEKNGERLYTEHHVVATQFWIGESASEDNAHITNEVTAWDNNPVERFGGVDDPNNPPEIVKHNRFYFALPVNEFDKNGPIPGIRERSPWRNEPVGENQSLFKGRWIRATNIKTGKTVFAQWLDTGPCDEDVCNDPDYVFDANPPQNDFGLRAGLDLSPSAMKDLEANGSAKVTWEFVDAPDVPAGIWLDDPLITNETHWD